MRRMSSPPPPRRRNAEATRAALLDAARACFRQQSYETVGLRDIAGAAGADVALIGRYFGSKAGLFREVLRGDRLQQLKDDLPEAARMADYLTQQAMRDDAGKDDEGLDRLLILLRSASSREAAPIIHEAVREDALKPFTARLGGGEDAELRASFLLAALLGTAIVKRVLKVEPVCESGDCPHVAQRVRNLFAAALDDLPEP